MIIWSQLNTEQQAEALARPALADDSSLKETVTGIISQIKRDGDQAVLELTQKFDCAQLQSLTLSSDALNELAQSVDEEVQRAIVTAYDNIKAFHEAQNPESIVLETTQGVVCEQHFTALEAVGLYIPGGTAPLPSTVLMLGVPSQVAQCPTRVLCTPANKDGLIAPEIAFAAQLCGIDTIYLCGGAQAIAAMAFGTQSITKVDKIFGPGNSFVTEAKQQVSQSHEGAAIDMPAGPSEVLVLADEHANPAFVASDLLSQAEHGHDSQAILVCNSKTVIESVIEEVRVQIASLSRADILSKAMCHARYILTDSVEQAIEVSNQYAPEHLIVQLTKACDLLPKIKHAGSIFVGPWSPESAGDYASGTNHVLPTYGYSRNYNSLGLVDFMRRYTVQTLSQTGLRYLGPAIMKIAQAEGLSAHENAVKIRLDALNNKGSWNE